MKFFKEFFKEYYEKILTRKFKKFENFLRNFLHPIKAKNH